MPITEEQLYRLLPEERKKILPTKLLHIEAIHLFTLGYKRVSLTDFINRAKTKKDIHRSHFYQYSKNDLNGLTYTPLDDNFFSTIPEHAQQFSHGYLIHHSHLSDLKNPDILKGTKYEHSELLPHVLIKNEKLTQNYGKLPTNRQLFLSSRMRQNVLERKFIFSKHANRQFENTPQLKKLNNVYLFIHPYVRSRRDLQPHSLKIIKDAFLLKDSDLLTYNVSFKEENIVQLISDHLLTKEFEIDDQNNIKVKPDDIEVDIKYIGEIKNENQEDDTGIENDPQKINENTNTPKLEDDKTFLEATLPLKTELTDFKTEASTSDD